MSKFIAQRLNAFRFRKTKGLKTICDFEQINFSHNHALCLCVRSPVVVCWASAVWCRSPAGWGSSDAEPPAAPQGAYKPPGTETISSAKPHALQPPPLSEGEKNLFFHFYNVCATFGSGNIHNIWTWANSAADLLKCSQSGSIFMRHLCHSINTEMKFLLCLT